MAFLLRSRNEKAIAAADGDVPAGALAYLDFLNEVYYAGSHQAVSSLLGGTFDVSKIEARGLYISSVAGGQHSPNAIGPLFTVLSDGLANGCTIITEFEPIADNLAQSTAGLHVYYFDNTDPDLATEFLSVESAAGGGSGVIIADGAGFTFGPLADNFNTPVAQPQRVAATIARDITSTRQYAMSTNGSTADTDTHATAHAFTPARIALWAVAEWSWWPDDWCVRSMTVYPAQDPADLPALSTL